MASSQVELLQPPPDAISSLSYSPQTPTLLLSSCWDKNVYLYDTHRQPGGHLKKAIEHQAPVLGVCFGKDDNEAFSAGLDGAVKKIDLETGHLDELSKHSSGAKSIVYCPVTSTIISASWDNTLHINDSRCFAPPTTITLPHKPFCLSLSASKLVVGMASRALHIYDLPSIAALHSQSGQTVSLEPWQRRESSLKFMTRTVACMPNDDGYATSSIEGRVAVEWFDPSPASQARKYAFKCHRQPSQGNPNVDVVYPVNALAFHPVHGTFASGGGDGLVALWDAVAKRRIRQYQRYPQSIAALAFSSDGKYLAVASCPGFEDGKEDLVAEGETKLFIRELADGEGKGKGVK
ncbi:MAG: hypothetical protein M1839_003376 [Geoglossum umbratile]|nr:MAG: hypothetical protein M1839_003376 [Geoglossum umbratile]